LSGRRAGEARVVDEAVDRNVLREISSAQLRTEARSPRSSRDEFDLLVGGVALELLDHGEVLVAVAAREDTRAPSRAARVRLILPIRYFAPVMMNV